VPTAVLADDEDLQLLDLKHMLHKLWPELTIVAEAVDGGDALDAIAQHQPDIAFLDIRMPEISGLDVARATAGKCRIVFTTAYDNHAIDAFQLGAVDYLLKPINFERLEHTIERLKSQLETKPNANDLMRIMGDLDKHLKQSAAVERIRWISANVGKLIKIIPIEDVIYFESDLRYTKVVCKSDEAFVRTSLKDLQKGLDPDLFWQIHRGSVVAATAIKRARRDDLGNIIVELRDREEELKVSNTYAWRFKGM